MPESLKCEERPVTLGGLRQERPLGPWTMVQGFVNVSPIITLFPSQTHTRPLTSTASKRAGTPREFISTEHAYRFWSDWQSVPRKHVLAMYGSSLQHLHDLAPLIVR